MERQTVLRPRERVGFDTLVLVQRSAAFVLRERRKRYVVLVIQGHAHPLVLVAF